ncbi:E3 ubiquitin-protein ligase PUB23 [Apostasia shenzhenica]|uniref:U-box domain-containing protein n=1 Tax=Apostasia shenzhenica TaxID=1088818 RepID=A0A2I0AQ33_9ASPA|nr:E3 ubiquitin-protein ligase PUB23 [Apostasia shenzhenica]
MAEVEIPSYFLCPISLQMMRDPVTLPTGITYDRESIERWVFSGEHRSCPVTKQQLPPSFDLTPNHTLRRLIQAWCIANASSGVDRIPTPRPPIDDTQISKLLEDASSSHTQLSICLRKLGEAVSESEANRRCVKASPAVEFLVSIIAADVADGVCDEAVGILHSLKIGDERLIRIVESSEGGFIDSMFMILQRSSFLTRAPAICLLSSIVAAVSPARLLCVEAVHIQEVISVLSDRISNQATKSALRVLIGLSPWGRNRVKAVKAGGVPALIKLLLEEADRRICELGLVALDKLCGCADGRAELVCHAAGIAVVSDKVLTVSAAASATAVKVLRKVCVMSATPAVLQEMLQSGAVAKLCLLLQVDCRAREKEMATEILRLHSMVWRKSNCSPVFLALKSLHR